MSTGDSLECPNCHKPLKLVLNEDIEVHSCPNCNGVWVNADEETVLLKMKPEVFTVEDLRRLRKLYKPLGITNKVRLRACPVCKELMYRRNWGGHSGVIVDKCEDHGKWYDAGEVEKIREYIKLGGIEFEKMRMPQEGLDRLESKLIQQDTRLSLAIDSAYRRARLWSLIGF